MKFFIYPSLFCGFTFLMFASRNFLNSSSWTARISLSVSIFDFQLYWDCIHHYCLEYWLTFSYYFVICLLYPQRDYQIFYFLSKLHKNLLPYFEFNFYLHFAMLQWVWCWKWSSRWVINNIFWRNYRLWHCWQLWRRYSVSFSSLFSCCESFFQMTWFMLIHVKSLMIHQTQKDLSCEKSMV